MQRIDAVRALAPLVTSEDLFVVSVGALENDWWNCRPQDGHNSLSLGILGSISSTALGLAIALPHRRIVSLETDGSMLMNIGVMCTLGRQRPPNLTVIVFDNGVYESIGGPPTLTSGNTDLAGMAAAAGCVNCLTVRDVERFGHDAHRLLNDGELGFLVAKVERGVHQWPKAKRRATDAVEDKYRFLRHVEKMEGIVIHTIGP
ncbi:MAG: thiamine pyrophosphate-binding protein [Chloroflexi bacterium]|nr:thiamine pyrophosphate-binding protein [Chloroflexota bacterium]